METQGADKSRARVNLACKHCRQRKIRCDGTLPTCSNCSRLRRVCTYERVPAEENLATRERKRRNKQRKLQENLAAEQYYGQAGPSQLGMVHSESSSSLTSSLSASDQGGSGGPSIASPSYRTGSKTLAQRRARGATETIYLESAPSTLRHAPYPMSSPSRTGPAPSWFQGSAQQWKVVTGQTPSFSAQMLSSQFLPASSEGLYPGLPPQVHYTAQSLGTPISDHHGFQWDTHVPSLAAVSTFQLRRKSSFDSSGITETLRYQNQQNLAHHPGFGPSLPPPLSGHELNSVPAPDAWGLLPADTTTLHLNAVGSVPSTNEGPSGQAGAQRSEWRGDGPGLQIGSANGSAIPTTFAMDRWTQLGMASTPVHNGSGVLPLPWRSPDFDPQPQHVIGQALDRFNTSNDSSQAGSAPVSTSTSEGGSQVAAHAFAPASSTASSLSHAHSVLQQPQYNMTLSQNPPLCGPFSSASGSPRSSVPSIHGSSSRDGDLSFPSSGSIVRTMSSSGQILSDASRLVPSSHLAGDALIQAATALRQQDQQHGYQQMISSPQQTQQQQQQQHSPQTTFGWGSSVHSPSSPAAQINRNMYGLQQLSMTSPSDRWRAHPDQVSRSPSFISPDAFADVPQGSVSSSVTSPGSVGPLAYETPGQIDPSSLLWQQQHQQLQHLQHHEDVNGSASGLDSDSAAPLAEELALFQDHSGYLTAASAQSTQDCQGPQDRSHLK
ncbi:hypothetical protein CF327_g1809 [Tilletia walkeri]|nr:hypothetical protein CF327_g1809 [Tilletia walkeri]